MRNEDGLFKTHCELCGAVVWSSSDALPVPNCPECPGHDDIARRNQESADLGFNAQGTKTGRYPSGGEPNVSSPPTDSDDVPSNKV